MLKFIDTHAHLTDEQFKGIKFDKEFFTADGFEVEKIITVAYDKQSIKDVIELILKHDNIYGEIGVHPDDANCFDDEVIELLKTAKENKKIVAIGEIGLDYYHKDGDLEKIKQKQKEVFVKQLEIAHELELPIVIHSRDAIGDTLEILISNRHLLKHGGVLHCFSESLEVYKEIEKLGILISVGGVVTFKNSKKLPEVLKYMNWNDILIETDCPYLTPEPYRGKMMNTPILARYTVMKVAELMEKEPAEICEMTNRNAYRTFSRLK